MTPNDVFPHSDLKELPLSLFEELVERGRIVEHIAGHEVFHRDDPMRADAAIYLVLEGKLKVTYLGTNEHDEEKEKGPGQVFGEFAFFHKKETRSADVKALTNVKLLRWGNARLLLDDPQFEPFHHRLSVLSNAVGAQTKL